MISTIANEFEKISARKWLYIVVGSISISVLCFFILQYSQAESKNKTKSTFGEGIVGTKAESGADKQVNELYIDISGAVKNPDLYNLPEGSRVMDVLKEAGGLLDEGNIAWVAKNLNVARKLKDSDKIYIPFEWEVYESSMSTSAFLSDNFPNGTSTSIVNINTATKIQLESLSGVGPVYADRIIQYRPYKDIGELGRIAKIPSSTLSKITELITF